MDSLVPNGHKIVNNKVAIKIVEWMLKLHANYEVHHVHWMCIMCVRVYYKKVT
jgi:hypothetical protein